MNDYIMDPLGRGPRAPPPPQSPRIDVAIMGGDSHRPIFPDIGFEDDPIRMENAPPVIYVQGQQHTPPVIHVQGRQHQQGQPRQQRHHHPRPQMIPQHDGMRYQEQPPYTPSVATPRELNAPLSTESPSPYAAPPPQVHHAPLTARSQQQFSPNHMVQHQQQQQYMVPALPPRHYDEPTTIPSTFQGYQHSHAPLHSSFAPPEHFHQQGNKARARNTADFTSPQSIPLAAHETSYDDYQSAPRQEQRGGSSRHREGYQQSSNDHYQFSNHQYSPAHAHDMRYPQHIDDVGRSHNHPQGTVCDFHPDTRHYYHGGGDQRHLQTGATNPPDQEIIISQARSARSEPPPRTRYIQQHHRIHKSESEASYYRNGNRSDSEYVNTSQYDNTNHDYSARPNGHHPIDALCCGSRRDVDDRGYDGSQQYDNHPNRSSGGTSTPRSGYYVDSPKEYEMERQRQHHVQQYYQENDRRKYRDEPTRCHNSDPLSPLSIPSCVDVIVENQYDYNQHGNNGHPKGGVMTNLPINHSYTNQHHRYIDSNHESIHVVPRNVVYPRKEHASKNRHYHETNAAGPPPFERRDDSCGSSTIYTGSSAPSPRQSEGHLLLPTSHEYSPRADFEPGRELYTAGKYRDEQSRLKIEIPTSPQVMTTVNNNNSVSSRPPLHTKLGQHYAKSPIAVNAERERRKSEARHQILKEIAQATNMQKTALDDVDRKFWDRQIDTLNQSFKKLEP